ncbi:probable ribosomal protein S11, mitochondrial [Diospyros lotus]|uniref:probable ribosomal protein S11, mitochondrial n=1 Tax=Diospyros lotus TaxID=55363 RepID=UPI002259254F|nr:probable ribosomal protein S11, mitochondrial [Diospyros lotus]
MLRLSSRPRFLDRAVVVFNRRSEGPLSSFFCESSNSDRSQIHGVRGLDDLKGSSYLHRNVGASSNINLVPQILGNLGAKLGFLKVNETVSPHSALSFRCFVHSSDHKEFETGRNSRSMDFARGIMERGGRDTVGGSSFGQYGVEHNADIVHIKLMRNNTFVSVTDSTGNKKVGASSGCLSEMKGGPKLSRYAAEATAEHVGRLARNLGLKSVVVKVNGFTHFKKKKQAILSFREGYTHSRGDRNPVVYIEDTTRKPHNGCRLRKKRRT